MDAVSTSPGVDVTTKFYSKKYVPQLDLDKPGAFKRKGLPSRKGGQAYGPSDVTLRLDFSPSGEALSNESSDSLPEKIRKIQSYETVVISNRFNCDVSSDENTALIVRLKARVASLETKLQVFKCASEENCAGHDKIVDNCDRQNEELKKRILVLERELSFIDEKHSLEINQLATERNELSVKISDLQQKLETAKQQNSKMRSLGLEKLQQAQRSAKEAHSEMLKATKRATDAEILCQQQTEELSFSRNQIDGLQSQIHDFTVQIETESAKNRKLQSEINDQTIDSIITQSLSSDLSDLKTLRIDNERLKRENKRFSDINENTLLLEEQVSFLTETNKQLQTNYDALMLETAELKAIMEEDGASYDAVDSLSRKVCQLSKDEMTLKKRYENTSLEHSSTVNRLETANGELVVRVDDLTTRLNDSDASLLALVEKYEEVEASLESYMDAFEKLKEQKEQDDQVISDLRHECEDFLASAKTTSIENEKKQLEINEVNEKLTLDIDQLTTLVSELRQNALKETSDQSTVTTTADVSEDYSPRCESSSDNINSEDILRLKNDLLSKQAEIEHLNLKLEQGDFCPSDEKIQHIQFNPLDDAHQELRMELEMLREENSKLKVKMESTDAQNRSLVSNESVMMSTAQVKEIEDLQRTLKKVKSDNIKRHEEFMKMSKRFREVSALLTGFQIKAIEDRENYQLYTVQSMFEKDPQVVAGGQPCFVFKKSSDGNLELIDNEYVTNWIDFVDTYLKTDHCFPAFLSAVTLQLYNKDESSRSQFIESSSLS